MATFRHVPTGKRFLFVHIPRTAGRFIETNLMVNNEFVWDDDWEGLGIGRNVMNMYKKVELAHFHKEYYEQYLDVDGIPHFSICLALIDPTLKEPPSVVSEIFDILLILVFVPKSPREILPF